MRNSLAEQIVLVTGAARGMGAQHVRGLVEAGARVVATDVLDDNGRSLAAELGDAVMFVHHDVTDEQQWIAAVAAAEARSCPPGHRSASGEVVGPSGHRSGW